MIYSIKANKDTFREVHLERGFNVVLADRTKASTKKDSRNGLGKSTLIEIIHFCLGAQARKGQGLCAPHLTEWEFTVELDVGDRRIAVTRAVSMTKEFRLTGDVLGLADSDSDPVILREKAWRELLGSEMFGIPPREEAGPWSPTFRAVFGFIVRRGKSAYLSPFENFQHQKTWDSQVQNAFLLGLAWEDAQAVQQIREKEKAVKALKAAAKAGVIDGILGDVGQLEADRVRLSAEVERSATRLASFRVHVEYRLIEEQASALTAEIHSRSNKNVLDTRRLQHLRSAVADEADEGGSDRVAKLYEAAGVQLSGMVVRQLKEVQSFHEEVIVNRRHFLTGQIEQLEKALTGRTDEVKELTDQRAELMGVLKQHGALEEYTALQQRHLTVAAKLKDIEAAVANLKKFEVGQSEIKVEKEQLHQRALRDYEERSPARERAIGLFNSHSEALYDRSGKLLINVAATGFKFGVEIERAKSDGVGSMQVFCYDLTLAELWAQKEPTPGFLVHDSLIFDGVDERQVGRALGRAAEVSRRADFQYLCTINSDAVPFDELPEGFNLDDYVRLRLTDASPEGSLLGIRF